ncbi:hypothetical protein RDWZM_005185 [Blomia tropicalis]|uniref:Uncharacterized protein n=1 Tax=Blomia tropicalis TaxID=40697 RepID=A0A9Q0M675_BLOTA|nr:hypothetical protein RDWZM_005185 [Blomia tropicalis]
MFVLPFNGNKQQTEPKVADGFGIDATCLVNCSEDEERLVRDLFRDYNKLIRPVKLINDTVKVEVKLSFIQLINIKWYDYQLTYDSADYGGLGVLRVPPDKVWKPDLVLFNNADGNYEVRFKSNCLIYPDGTVIWLPPAIYQSSCQIDVTYFPFDQQRCVMKFGSWTFNGDQVNLAFLNNKSHVDLSDYWKSGTWDIVDVPAYLNVYNNSKLGKPTETDISFYITIRRKTLFYTVNLILPTVLISFLCILVFYLPSEAGNIMSNETSPTQHHPNCIGSVAPPPPPPIASTNLSSIDRDITIRDNDSLDLYFMSPDAYRAAEAIDFIAEHLRNEDQYLQFKIREDWKYVAMVIDRLQLYLFFGITSFGTIAILLDAPHIFQPIDQDQVIKINRHE